VNNTLNIVYNSDIGAFVNEATPDVVAPQFEMLQWAELNPETTPPYNPQLINELLTVMKTPDSTIVEEGVESINNRG
tara:strand:+ start:67 stop:297 length:231 start_codon:yes stop_codon:yes gene_type:complete